MGIYTAGDVHCWGVLPLGMHTARELLMLGISIAEGIYCWGFTLLVFSSDGDFHCWGFLLVGIYNT